MTGRYDEVHTLAAPLGDDPAAAVLRARAYVAVGKYAEAEKVLQPAVSESPIGDAAVELGILRRLQGRRVEAMRTMSLILSREIAGASAADYVRAGRAARAIGRFQQANDFFREAVNRAPTDVNANIAWGELFLEKYERREAARSFEAALRGDANHPVALLGMARTVLEDNPPAARKLAQQTLAVNPNEAGAHVLLAQIALDDLKRDDARAEIEKALAINPQPPGGAVAVGGAGLAREAHHRPGRGHRGGAQDQPALRRGAPGDRRRVGARLPLRRGRRVRPQGLGARPRELPGLRRPRRPPDARRRRARGAAGARDRLPRRSRTTPSPTTCSACSTRSTASSRSATATWSSSCIPTRPAVMREYVPGLAKEALAQLSKRWNFTPTGPLLIEVFPRHDDFAVRTLGLPGMIGALGACFGRVVTMDSPQGAAAGRVQLGRHPVARAGPRDHPAAVEPARPALAHRGHLGVGGDAGPAASGAARWRSPSPARWSASR